MSSATFFVPGEAELMGTGPDVLSRMVVPFGHLLFRER